MSQRGKGYDNDESFWSRFKVELLHVGSLPDLAEAKLEIRHQVVYYNAEPHSTLGYHSSNYFEKQLQITVQFCPA